MDTCSRSSQFSSVAARPPVAATLWRAFAGLLAAVLVVGVLVPATRATAEGDVPFSVGGLTADSMTDPLGLDNPQPVLGWLLSSERRGVVQKAYRIRVATSADVLEGGRGDVWDSGVVQSAESANVRYGGASLRSATRYFWEVRVWDTLGNSALSPIAWWEMGLLRSADWGNSEWIGGSPIGNVHTDALTYDRSAPLLRKVFTLHTQPTDARLYISGIGMNVVTINGQRLDDRLLGPPLTNYAKTVPYNVYDVTSFLRDGENSIGVILGKGRFAAEQGDAWGWESPPWNTPNLSPRLRVRLHVDGGPGGAETTVVSDASWTTHAGGPTVANEVWYERYDARREIPGWDTAGFEEDMGWLPALVLPAPPGTLRSDMLQPIRVVDVVTAEEISNPAPGVYVYTFPYVLTGNARLTVSGPRGTKVTLNFDEHLGGDGLVTGQNHGYNRHVYGPWQQDEYTLAGDGVETWEPQFSWKGFQYVQVTGYPGVPDLDSVVAVRTHNDLESTGTFSSSNEMLNTMHDNMRRTILNNMYGFPSDTPTYEKNPWMGQVQFDPTFENFDSQRFFAKWLRDIQDTQQGNGSMPLLTPDPGWLNGITTAWSGDYSRMVWAMYEHFGDTAVVAQHYPNLRAYVDYVAANSPPPSRMTPSAFGLGDWSPPGVGSEGGVGPEGPAIVSMAYAYQITWQLAQMAELLGHTGDHDFYSDLADSIREAFNTNFYDPSAQVYATGVDEYRQTSNIIPVAFGITPPEEIPGVVANLVADIRARDTHLNTGTIGTFYILKVLTDHGYPDVAYELVTQTTYPSWGAQVLQGATTMWETWGPTSADVRSLNHLYFGSFEQWFYEELAGITATEPGFAQIRIRPHVPAELAHAEASMHTKRGQVSSSWTQDDDGILSLAVTIPANSTAEIQIPTASASTVTEGGVPADQADAVTYLRTRDGRAIYQVGSGTYHFTAQT